MKRSILIALLGWALGADAQFTKPYWISKPPMAENGNYYFRVTSAEAKNYEAAYVKAFAMAILESSWKLGVAVNTKDDLSAIEKGLMDNINIESNQINLPINKVCEYREKVAENQYVRLYILWQVARYGNVNPGFDDFNNCE